MKKFLSLVLALIMTMSLVTISAGAKDFTDDSKITYKEAVDVMSAVKVIDGYADGSFDPQGNLTRGAAAKIICNLILGPTTAAALRADTAPYKDVPVNHTFAGYIAYCQQKGIISGYADGTFRPSATLTNYAFLKMLLGALGYDAVTEGYVGDNWSIQVAKQALAAGLVKGMVTELNGTDAATREQACLYALNTLQATMVEYVQKTTVSVAGAQVTLAGSVRDVEWGTATLYDGNIEEDGYVQFAEKYFSNLELEVGHGIYGRPANTWRLKKSEIGTYTTKTPSYIYTEATEAQDVYKDLGKVICDLDEDEYEWEYYVNGKEVKDGYIPEKNDDDDYRFTGDGTVTEIYVKDSYRKDDRTIKGTVTVVEYNYYIGQVTKVKEDKDAGEIITIKALSKLSDEDPSFALDDKTFAIEGYEEDDYVVFTVDFNDDDDYVIGEVVEPETVTGDVKRVENDTKSKKTYLKMDDGEKYPYAESKNHNVFDLDNLITDKHPTLEESYTLYLDPNGFVLGFILDEGETKYLYVDDSDEELKDWVAKVYLTDGTKVKVDLKNKYKDLDKEEQKISWMNGTTPVPSTTGVTNIDHLIWKYSASDSGVYTLTEVEAVYPTAEYEINNGEAYVNKETDSTGTGEGLIVDKKTIFVDMDGEKAYTGYDEVPNIDHAEIAYVLKKGVVEVMFIIDGDIYDKDSTYFFLTGDKRTSFKYDGDEYWTFEKAYVNGEKTEVNVAYDALAAADSALPPISSECNLGTGILYKAKKSVSEDDVTYITKIEPAVPEISGDPVAVGDASFQVRSDTTANIAKFTAKETIFVLAEYQPKDMKEYEKAKKNGVVYNDPDDFEWVVSEGRISDMKTDNDDPYATTVAVIEKDDQDAELVYIYQVYPYVVGKTYDLTVNGVKVASYAEDETFSETIKATEGKKITAVTGEGITATIDASGKSATITGKMTKSGIAVTVTEETIVETKTLRLEATSLLSGKVYLGDGSGEALEPSKTENSFGVPSAVEYEIPAGETATIVYGSGTKKAVKMDKDVTITDDDLAIDAGTKVTITVDGKVVATPDKDQVGGEKLSGLTKNGWYIADGTGAIQADAKGEYTVTGLSKNRELVSAGEVSVESNASDAYAKDAVTVNKSGKTIVANGEVVTLTITGTVKITTADGVEIVTIPDGETKVEKTITVNGDIKVEDWETQADFEDTVAQAIKTNVNTNSTNKVTISGNTVEVEVTNLTATGTGLMDLVKDLKDDGYDVIVTAPNGYDYPLSGDTGKDKTKLGALIEKGAKGTFVVTISSDKADAEIVYTVNVDTTALS